MFSNQNEQALVDALKEKVDALKTIFEITELQSELLEQDDVTSLMDNIGLRQQWIDYVDKLDEQITALSLIVSPNAPEIKQEYEAIRIILEKISHQDAANEKKALAKLAEYKQELKNVKAEKTGFDGYVANGSHSGEAYFDQKQ